jgi:hypothetical protein
MEMVRLLAEIAYRHEDCGTGRVVLGGGRHEERGGGLGGGRRGKDRGKKGGFREGGGRK